MFLLYMPSAFSVLENPNRLSVTPTLFFPEFPDRKLIVDTGCDSDHERILGCECIGSPAEGWCLMEGRFFVSAAGVDEVLDAGIPPERVVVQVPASQTDGLTGFRDSLRSRGCGFALDHVSAEENSLHLIRELRPDYVKLDSALVAGAERPLYGATIRKLVEVCGRMNITVIARGVDHMHTLENLWLLGVRCMQGRLFDGTFRIVS